MTMKQRILYFDGLEHPAFDEREFTPAPEGRNLTLDFTTVSPGTELFCIRGGQRCYPGYIMVGHDAAGQPYFVFPAMAESHSAHCNVRSFGPDSLLLPLPERFPLELAGFLRFANIGLGPLLRYGALPGEVAVIGLGPVGNLAAQSAKLLGCRVVGVDPSAARRDLAAKCGIAETVTPEAFSGMAKSFDRVIDTVSASSTLAASAHALRDGGICNMVGIVKDGDLPASILCREIWDRDLRFVSGWEMKHPMSTVADHLTRAVRWIGAGAYTLRPLLTGIIKPELPAIAAAYRALAADPDRHICYVIDWRQS